MTSESLPEKKGNEEPQVEPRKGEGELPKQPPKPQTPGAIRAAKEEENNWLKILLSGIAAIILIVGLLGALFYAIYKPEINAVASICTLLGGIVGYLVGNSKSDSTSTRDS